MLVGIAIKRRKQGSSPRAADGSTALKITQAASGNEREDFAREQGGKCLSSKNREHAA
jgi:hypothetical protein